MRGTRNQVCTTRLTPAAERLIRKSGRSSRSLRRLVRCSPWKPEGKLMTAITESRNFDLNIEKVLEGWETCHGVREIIANALDEQVLTQTKDVEIYRDQDKTWRSEERRVG